MSSNNPSANIINSEEGPQMDLEQAKICKKILENLLYRPIAQLFYETPNDIELLSLPNPITLQYIEKRLENLSYTSTYDFVQDLRSVLFTGLISSDPFRKSGAKLLSSELEANITKLLPGLREIPRKLNQINLKISNIIESFPTNDEIFSNFDSNIQPACEILSNPDYQPEKATPISLKREISMIKSPSILTYVFALIYRYQPEVININDKLSINFALMDQKTIVAASNYLHILLKHALFSDIKTVMNAGDDDNNSAFPIDFIRIPHN